MYQMTRVESVLVLLINGTAVLAGCGGDVFAATGKRLIENHDLWSFAKDALGAEDIAKVEFISLSPEAAQSALVVLRNVRKAHPKKDVRVKEPVVEKAREMTVGEKLLLLRQVAATEGWNVNQIEGRWIIGGKDSVGKPAAATLQDGKILGYRAEGLPVQVLRRNTWFAGQVWTKIQEELEAIRAAPPEELEPVTFDQETGDIIDSSVM